MDKKEYKKIDKKLRQKALIHRKKISDLIIELKKFDKPELEVRISITDGKNSFPISMLGNFNTSPRLCVLFFALFHWLQYVLPNKGLSVPIIEDIPEYIDKGKTIRQLIEELDTFEDQNRLVMISINDGNDIYPIHRIEKRNDCCILISDFFDYSPVEML